jgi:ABC-2 type transport system permease protein
VLSSPVPEWARAYPQLVRSAMQVTLAYRGRLVFLFTGALFPMLMLFVWLTVDAGGPTAEGWNAARFVSYYVAAAVVHDVTTSGISWAWDRDLRSGELSNRLLRPMPAFHQFVAAEAGERVVTAIVLVPVLIVLTLVLPIVSYSASALGIAAAFVATLLAFGLAVLMSSTFALIGFWTTQSNNVYMLWWGLGAFASGWIAPLDVMPPWLQRTAEILPFRYALGFPVEIAIGLSTRDIVVGFATVSVWIAFFGAAYVTMWRRGIKHYQAVGG